MFGASLGEALGAGVQGYAQGKKDEQSYRNNEQVMSQSADLHKKALTIKDQQIQANKTAERTNAAKATIAENQAWINTEATNQHKLAINRESWNSVYTDFEVGTHPNMDAVNGLLKASPELSQQFGINSVREYNPLTIDKHKIAKFISNGSMVPYDQQEELLRVADEFGKAGYIVMGDNGLPIDLQGMAVATGGTKGMSKSRMDKVRDKSLGILQTKVAPKHIPLTDNEEYEASSMYKKNKPKTNEEYRVGFRQFKGEKGEGEEGEGFNLKNAHDYTKYFAGQLATNPTLNKLYKDNPSAAIKMIETSYNEKIKQSQISSAKTAIKEDETNVLPTETLKGGVQAIKGAKDAVDNPTSHEEFRASPMYKDAVAKNNGKDLVGTEYETAYNNWTGTTPTVKSGSTKVDDVVNYTQRENAQLDTITGNRGANEPVATHLRDLSLEEYAKMDWNELSRYYNNTTSKVSEADKKELDKLSAMSDTIKTIKTNYSPEQTGYAQSIGNAISDFTGVELPLTAGVKNSAAFSSAITSMIIQETASVSDGRPAVALIDMIKAEVGNLSTSDEAILSKLEKSFKTNMDKYKTMRERLKSGYYIANEGDPIKEMAEFDRTLSGDSSKIVEGQSEADRKRAIREKLDAI